jgi:hypothetical protein
MKESRKVRSFAYGVVLIGFVIYVITFFYKAIVSLPSSPVIIKKVAPSEFVSLFNSEARHRLRFKETWSSNSRASISFFTYGEKYELEMTEMGRNFNTSLVTGVIESYVRPKGRIGIKIPAYKTEFTTNYKDPSSGPESKIYVSLIGDSTLTVLKDANIVEYYLKLEHIYVQYKPDGEFEISIDANTRANLLKTEKPASVMFLRKKDSLYFLLLTSKDKTVKLPPGLLNSLVSTP